MIYVYHDPMVETDEELARHIYRNISGYDPVEFTEVQMYPELRLSRPALGEVLFEFYKLYEENGCKGNYLIITSTDSIMDWISHYVHCTSPDGSEIIKYFDHEEFAFAGTFRFPEHYEMDGEGSMPWYTEAFPHGFFLSEPTIEEMAFDRMAHHFNIHGDECMSPEEFEETEIVPEPISLIEYGDNVVQFPVCRKSS